MSCHSFEGSFRDLWIMSQHNLVHLLDRNDAFPSVLLQNYFARNFYNMRMLALFVAFAINFILLFYKVKRCCEGHPKSHQTHSNYSAAL